MATDTVLLNGAEWTLVADHADTLCGYVSNDRDYNILVRTATVQPDPDDWDGHFIRLSGKSFDLSNKEDLYARLWKYGIPPSNETYITVSTPCSISSSDHTPYDLYSNHIVDVRRLKTSSRDSKIDASINGKLYSFSGSRLVPLSQTLGLNITAAAQSIIHSIEISSDLKYEIYSGYPTGSADGILNAYNLNLTSEDVSPATLQIIDNITPAGARLYWTSGETSGGLIFDENSELSISVANTTTGSVTIQFTIIFEEIGARSPFFGLTASTFLEPDTEMSVYG